MPSQTFIRREITALEAQGFVVHRFAMRRFAGKLVDEADQAEQRRTYFLLDAGALGLGHGLLADRTEQAEAMVQRPWQRPSEWVCARNGV